MIPAAQVRTFNFGAAISMDTILFPLLDVAIVNAITVIPLAAAAWMAGRFLKHPPLTHALWVLVLAKLITPPLFQLPYSIESLASRPAAAVDDATLPMAAATPAVATRSADVSTPSRTGAGAIQAPSRSNSAVRSTAPAVASPARSSSTSESLARWGRRQVSNAAAAVAHPTVRGAILFVWLAGSLAWFGRHSCRALRFARCLRRVGIDDPELQAEVDAVARQMGLAHSPRVLLIDATLSPMLWGFGRRAKMLAPTGLIQRLTADSRATLIAHELAHFSRGDHWVRIVELLTLGLFWWHPVAWWARRQIEISEEECCDAWVVRQFPESPRRYADALLDTIDFLCEERVALPPLASGLGDCTFLRRRLTRIMNGVCTPQLSGRVRGVLALLAAAALPLQPFSFGSPSTRPGSRPATNVSLTPLPDPSIGNQSLDDSTDESTDNLDHDSTQSMEPTFDPVPRAMRGQRNVASAASPSGRYVVKSTTGRQVLLMNLDQDKGGVTDLSAQNIKAVAFLPDGESFLAAHGDGRVTRWDAPSAKIETELRPAGSALRSVDIAPDGSHAAIGGDGLAQIIDLESGEVAVDLSQQGSFVNCVRYSPDGRLLAVASGDWDDSKSRGGLVSVWDIGRREVINEIAFDDHAPGALSFATSAELFVGQWGGFVSYLKLGKGTVEVVASAQAEKSVVDAAAFSPNDAQLQNVTFTPLATQTASVLDFGRPIDGLIESAFDVTPSSSETATAPSFE